MKTTMRYLFTNVITVIKNAKYNRFWQGCDEWESLHIVVGNKLVQPLWQTLWSLLENFKIKYHMIH